MPKFKDLTGSQVGDLTVVGLSDRYKNGKISWNCRCKCGKDVRRTSYDLTRKYRVDCFHETPIVSASKTHGMSKTKLYFVWIGIKGRCYNEKNKSFHNYGGRGIKMCPEWKHDFTVFQNWALSNGYKEGLSIDRIDVNGDYCPENCRWATVKEQSRNRRDNIVIEHDGKKMILSDWAEYYGVDKMLVNQRYVDFLANSEEVDFAKLFHKGRLDVKRVNQYSLDGTFIKTWNSLSDAGRNGYDATGISMCCHGKRKTANGYIWKLDQV